MIYESSYWKNELSTYLKNLNKRRTQKVWRDASLGSLEKEIMISCYICRKLNEAKKITSKIYDQEIQIEAYKPTGKPIDLLSRGELGNLYELSKKHIIRKKFSFVVNQIIHSYIFSPVFNQEYGLHGIIFNSDTSKHSSLYFLDINAFIKILSKIANFYITHMRFKRNEHGELEIINMD